MAECTASRTLVKSAPELWAECSDAASLARHLGAFGEIRITKLEPETAVAWEGDAARGTVTLESSGWGTRVVLTAIPDPGGAVEPTEPEPPRDEPHPSSAQRARSWPARVFLRWSRRAGRGAAPSPEGDEPTVRRDEPAAGDAHPPDRALTEALSSLGRAHHRPFSRA